MQSLNWYVKRLGAMSGREIMFRVGRAVRIHRQRWHMCCPPREAVRVAESMVRWLPAAPSITTEPYIRAADEIVAGKLRIFVHDSDAYGEGRDWNRDPVSGKVAPLAYAKTLDYRDSSIVGDIKHVWEPNRHLHLVSLAQAFNITGDNRYLTTLEEHVDTWIDQSPYPRGVNWVSGLELGIRLINWSIAWHLVVESGEFSADVRDRWLASIYRHCKHIENYFSRYSSANNHLIGEAAGLFVATCTWPLWPETQRWQARSQAILEDEIKKQIGCDGVGLEQAISYQQFILDFLIMAALAGRPGGVEFSDAYWSRIEAALEFIAALLDAGGNMPMIGDADDGFVSDLAPDPDFCPYRSLLATGSILLDREDFAHCARTLDDKTRWLLGDQVTAGWLGRGSSTGASLPTRFDTGGYYLLGSEFGTEREIRILVDAGPLGYESIAAHGHADALAVCLSVFGEEVLIDPGTYAYHTKQEWRDYFRGTSSHNTVEIDGSDQSLTGGDFLWTTHANASLLVYDAAEGVFEGEHDGYGRLDDPVTHRRSIKYDRSDCCIRITDDLSAGRAHRAARWWHFSERCRIRSPVDGVIVANTGSAEIVLRAGESDLTQRILCGSTEPIAGWVSRRFDEKIETTSVVWRSEFEGSATLETTIEIRPSPSA